MLPQPVPPIKKFTQASYPYPSEGRQNENQNHRKLTKLITWTTALSNSVKLWPMLCRATQDGWVMVESSDRMWSTGERNGKPLQYSCLENVMNSMKRQKDRTLKDELSKSVQFSSVQSLSHVRLFAAPWITARQASLFITISQSSLRLMSIGA